MKIPFRAFLSGFFLLICCSAYADTAADLTEDNIAAGVPGAERAAPSNFHGILGPGLLNFKKVVGENDRKTALLPIVIVTYRDLAYWSLGGGGVWLLQTDDRSAKLGLGIKVHQGWKPEDDPLLAGMSDRDVSVDGSVNALWRTSFVTLTAAFYHDIGGVSKGSFATARLSHNFWFERFRLTPSIGAEWQSARLVDYYYGVRESETLIDRPFYAGRETVNFSLGLGGLYVIDRRWSLLGGLYGIHYGSGITDSPIVKQNNSALVYAGAAWLF